MTTTFRLVLPSFPFSGCLFELRACYSAALRKAGYAVTLADTYLDMGEAGEDYQLAFGAHAVAPPPDDDRMVICQSEHHAVHFSREYREILTNARWVMNMGPFDLPGDLNTHYGLVECPPGIMSDDRTGYACDRDIPVLFYGSVTSRRAAILESLAKAGIKVTSLYGVLGPARDAYIDRAKIVLDLKQDGTEPPDVTRVFWALSRGVCTLSENAPDDSPAKITPETVVQVVKEYLDGPAEHRNLCRDMYARQIGDCDIRPLLSALGLS